MFNTRHNHKEEELLEEILEAERRIEHDLRPHRFTLFVKQLKEHTMSLGNIPAGQTGTFAAALLLNGAPYAPTTPFALAVTG